MADGLTEGATNAREPEVAAKMSKGHCRCSFNPKLGVAVGLTEGAVKAREPDDAALMSKGSE